MGPSYLNRLVFIVSLSSLFFFFYSAEALCVPRNLTLHKPPHISFSSPPQPKPEHNPATPPVRKKNPGTNIKIDPVVNKICHATDYPHLCISSVTHYLHGKANLATIFEAEIRACRHKTRAVSALAIKKSQDPKVDPPTVSSLKDCKDSFSDVLENLQEAENAMKVHDIGTVNTMLSAAVSDVGDCDDWISNNQEVKQLMSRPDAILIDLISNCLAIASLVK
ncbi:putative pectinesterase/pectinesterase inhibitor 26 [Macadamia integrifolia]|uniref:putative pectinesterase/pectinesterase inhibitor 26 n=1 Tax=Macadamia integrifolia TaxID=60698 RepID=UPI001C528951|nr:putative pectinesterase/pectinesterase inhibitor 26 [Macadamia integrifolia]